MGKTVGMYGGKFLPPHLGHVYAMTLAASMVDELHVVVSHDHKYEMKLCEGGKLPHMPWNQRYRWWQQITKHLPNVVVHTVYEEQTGQFSDWENGRYAIELAVGKKIDAVFSSENEYDTYFKLLYPEAEHILLDVERKKYPISGTKLRKEGILANWDMVPQVVRQDFVKRVVIVGTESCGKSTLVQNLATLYNTTYVSEYGREFYEQFGDRVMSMPEDFAEIAMRHKVNEMDKLKEANKVLFIDTEAYVTNYYSRLYENKEDGIVEAIGQRNHYDLCLFLEPDVKWVDDGTRDFGEQKARENNSDYLKRMLDRACVDYVSVSGSYLKRLKTTMKHIDKLLEGK